MKSEVLMALSVFRQKVGSSYFRKFFYLVFSRVSAHKVGKRWLVAALLHTEKIFEILLNQSEIRLYLPFSG